MGTMETFVRPLSEKERRLLNSAVHWRQRRLKNFPKRLLTGGLLVFGALWLWTLIATRDRWYIVTAFWIGIGGVISLWIFLKEKPKVKSDLRTYEQALRRNEARVTRIQSQEMVELEEEEDEGACYAFQLDDNKIVLVTGQDFYASTRFPNTDFSLVRILGENDVAVELFIEKSGQKLRPKRRIAAKAKSKMRVPGHLEVIEGRLDQLEQLLQV